MVRVVRTRRIRAIDERYFGRTARMYYVGVGASRRDEAQTLDANDLAVAVQESEQAFQAQRLWSFIRHARIPPERAAEFWTEAMTLVQEFDRSPIGDHRLWLRGLASTRSPTTRHCPSLSNSGVRLTGARWATVHTPIRKTGEGLHKGRSPGQRPRSNWIVRTTAS